MRSPQRCRSYASLSRSSKPPTRQPPIDLFLMRSSLTRFSLGTVSSTNRCTLSQQLTGDFVFRVRLSYRCVDAYREVHSESTRRRHDCSQWITQYLTTHYDISASIRSQGFLGGQGVSVAGDSDIYQKQRRCFGLASGTFQRSELSWTGHA